MMKKGFRRRPSGFLLCPARRSFRRRPSAMSDKTALEQLRPQFSNRLQCLPDFLKYGLGCEGKAGAF
jgi:hypothetical protein